MNKSYYVKTFQLNYYLMVLNLLILMMGLGIYSLKTVLLSNKYAASEPFAREAGEKVALFLQILHFTNLAFLLGLIALVTPELVNRVRKDSLVNWIRSTWVSLRLRGFLARQSDHEGEGTFKLQRHNKAIWKTVIDVKKSSVTLVIKLPNDSQAQKMILESEAILREEVSNRFLDYLFSNYQRYNHWLQITGTKKR